MSCRPAARASAQFANGPGARCSFAAGARRDAPAADDAGTGASFARPGTLCTVPDGAAVVVGAGVGAVVATGAVVTGLAWPSAAATGSGSVPPWTAPTTRAMAAR